MRRSSMLAVLALMSGLTGLWALYSFLFFAWVTATPVSAERLVQAQRAAGLWCAGLTVSFIVLVVASIAAFRLRRAGR